MFGVNQLGPKLRRKGQQLKSAVSCPAAVKIVIGTGSIQCWFKLMHVNCDMYFCEWFEVNFGLVLKNDVDMSSSSWYWLRSAGLADTDRWSLTAFSVISFDTLTRQCRKVCRFGWKLTPKSPYFSTLMCLIWSEFSTVKSTQMLLLTNLDELYQLGSLGLLAGPIGMVMLTSHGWACPNQVLQYLLNFPLSPWFWTLNFPLWHPTQNQILRHCDLVHVFQGSLWVPFMGNFQDSYKWAISTRCTVGAYHFEDLDQQTHEVH